MSASKFDRSKFREAIIDQAKEAVRSEHQRTLDYAGLSSVTVIVTRIEGDVVHCAFEGPRNDVAKASALFANETPPPAAKKKSKTKKRRDK